MSSVRTEYAAADVENADLCTLADGDSDGVIRRLRGRPNVEDDVENDRRRGKVAKFRKLLLPPHWGHGPVATAALLRGELAKETGRRGCSRDAGKTARRKAGRPIPTEDDVVAGDKPRWRRG